MKQHSMREAMAESRMTARHWREAARDQLNEVMCFQPDSMEAPHHLTHALSRHGESTAGEKVFHRVLTLQPDLAAAMSNYSLVLTQQRRILPVRGTTFKGSSQVHHSPTGSG